MDGFEWTLCRLILILKVIFLTDIPLTYIKIKKLNLDILGLTKRNLASATIIGVILAILLYLIEFYWAFYLFSYGWSDIIRAKLYLGEMGYGKYILFSLFDSLLNLGIPEEIFFRGFIFSISERKLGLKYAIIISSVTFTLCHINRIFHIPLMLIYGFILSYTFYKLKNITLPVIAHSLFNLILYLQIIWI